MYMHVSACILLFPIYMHCINSMVVSINFIAPSPPFRDDQAVDAHTTRAPAPIQPIRVEGPDLWSQMELVDTMIEQSLVSSTGGARNSECVDCVGGVSEAGWGGLRGVGGWLCCPTVHVPPGGGTKGACQSLCQARRQGGSSSVGCCWWRRGLMVPSWGSDGSS